MQLSELGLTENEIKVYEAVLKLGKVTSSVVSAESGVSYGRIYNVLASLESKGLVKTIPEKTKKFIPADPKQLHDFILSKKQALEEAEKKILEYKKIYESSEKESVSIVKGKNNFYRLIREMKKPEKYEYDIKYNFESHPEFMREADFLINKKGSFKCLGRIDKETEKNVHEWKKVSKNIKQIENDGIAMAVIDDFETMITLINSNTILLIRDKAFAKIMKKMFEATYEKAEGIK
ncbi:MAG: helix-turn-helix domain-containing protein [Nanoarchaeota archaeon]